MQKRFIILLLLTAMVSTNLEVYGGKGDTIEKILDQSREVMYSDPEQTLSMAQKALSLAKELNDSVYIIESIKMQGIAHDIKGHNNKALDTYNSALKLAQESSNKFQEASMHCNIGLVYINMGRLKTALENLLPARQIFETMFPESNELAHTLNNIGSIYLHMHHLAKALSYFNLALEIYEKNSNSLSMGAVMNNIANVYIHQDRHHDARNILLESIALKENHSDYYGLSISTSRLGALMLEKDSLDKAQHWLEKAHDYANKTSSSNQIIYIYQQKQKLFFNRGEYQKAIRYNRMAYDLSVDNDSWRHQKRSLKIFSDIYETMGDYLNAHQYLLRYNQLNDSLISQEKMGKIYEMQLDFEIQKKEDEITILTKQQELDQLKIEKQELLIGRKRFQTATLTASLGLLLLLFYIRYIKYQHKQKLKMEMALASQRKRHSQNLLQAQEKERQRIGEDLHDGVCQILSMVKLSITDLIHTLPATPSVPNQRFKEMLGLVDNAFHELRTVSHNLSPVTLHQKGLIPAIKEIVTTIHNNGNYRINLQVIGFTKPLNSIIETSIYRIVQELTTNIIRHAEAKKISLELVRNHEEINIIVEDDGKGFDPAKTSKGMGFFNLKMRLDNLSGTMHVDSKPDRGTIITINIPIQQDDET